MAYLAGGQNPVREIIILQKFINHRQPVGMFSFATPWGTN
jgi:hypothetical protein